MVRSSVQGKLHMRKQKNNATVPLDVVPERRTKRCSPRFRPGGRFWGEPRFRYLSPGSEGEKCRPLDHLWQTPFIHSARLTSSRSFYIYRAVFYLSPPFGTFKFVLLRYLFCNCACTFEDQLLQALLLLCSMRYRLVRADTNQTAFTHAHLVNKRNCSLVTSVLLQAIN